MYRRLSTFRPIPTRRVAFFNCAEEKARERERERVENIKTYRYYDRTFETAVMES
jgi:hypothetical protein